MHVCVEFSQVLCSWKASLKLSSNSFQVSIFFFPTSPFSLLLLVFQMDSALQPLHINPVK